MKGHYKNYDCLCNTRFLSRYDGTDCYNSNEQGVHHYPLHPSIPFSYNYDNRAGVAGKVGHEELNGNELLSLW